MKRLSDYKFGDLFILEDFLDCVKQGSFIDYDGYGYSVSEAGDVLNETPIYPSQTHKIPKGTTHILWFNR
jgi:hypothetical protein